MKIATSELEHLREEVKNCHQIIKDLQKKREFVGLTDEEMTHTNHHMVEGAYQYSFKQGAKWAEAKLKEKNTHD